MGLIVQGISEKMLENNGHIHVDSPRAGTGNLLISYFGLTAVDLKTGIN